jgi:LysM repeat protein
MKKKNLLMMLALFVNNIVFSQKNDQFGLDSINKKLIDNKGKGFDSLIGCRNVRVVLKNLVYRGGNNNPLSVMNPLTLGTISDLNNLGFNDIRYLYSKNFTKYYPIERLDSLKNSGINYTCMSRLDSTNVFNFFTTVHQKVNANSDSMIYLHCWNGWHQSGWIAALTLIQFCDLDNQTAISYWASNTDKNYVGYDRVKKGIKEFKPFPNLFFTEQQKKDYCPCLNKEKLTKEYPLNIVYSDKNSIKAPTIKSIPDTVSLKIKKEETKTTKEREREIEQSSDYKKKKIAEEKNNLKYHIVKKGDTLSEIANKYNTTISKICSLNRINAKDIIQLGQKIQIK